MPRAVQPSFSSVCTSSGFTSRFSTCSTTSMACSSVTRSPFTNFAGRPFSVIAREIALPPPWTTTGRRPTHAMKAMSVRTFSTPAFSSIVEPPTFTTTISPRNFWM
jgi:hypothetical protein